MFKPLEQYRDCDSFIFTPNDSLVDVCNAPDKKSGVYILIAKRGDDEDIVYIGSSGKMQTNGVLKTRKGGMRDRLINGKDSTGMARKKSWILRMGNEEIDQLVIQWWVTFDLDNKHIPVYVEAMLIQEFFDNYRKLPLWNNEF